jgi:hypothetical protein
MVAMRKNKRYSLSLFQPTGNALTLPMAPTCK